MCLCSIGLTTFKWGEVGVLSLGNLNLLKKTHPARKNFLFNNWSDQELHRELLIPRLSKGMPPSDIWSFSLSTTLHTQMSSVSFWIGILTLNGKITLERSAPNLIWCSQTGQKWVVFLSENWWAAENVLNTRINSFVFELWGNNNEQDRVEF